jgi:hypothetical protein
MSAIEIVSANADVIAELESVVGEASEAKVTGTVALETLYFQKRFPELGLDADQIAAVVKYHSEFQSWKNGSPELKAAVNAVTASKRTEKNAERTEKKKADAIALLESLGIPVEV